MNNDIICDFDLFQAPDNKAATYAQCSRLYAAALDYLPDNEYLVTSDVDMAVFKLPMPETAGYFTVYGADLVPEKQVPMCYLGAPVSLWREYFTKGRSLQVCLDDLLGDLEAEHFRGNYWAKDQEEAYNTVSRAAVKLTFRARPGTQFADHRVDRDDSFWHDRLNKDVVDAHLWRPLWTTENFENLLELLTFFYPDENLSWLHAYRNEYIKHFKPSFKS